MPAPRLLLVCALLAAPACATQRTSRPAVVAGAPGTAVDVEQLRLDTALYAREQLVHRLVAWGAIPRPPRPALLAEDAGAPPFEGAIWRPGAWVWMNGRWEWRAGTWIEPDVFEGSGGDGEVVVDASDLAGLFAEVLGAALDSGDDAGPRVRDHRDRTTTRVRDHRDRTPRATGSTIRDHRDGSSWGSSSVRDHRDDKSSSSGSSSSSKNDDEKHADPGGAVRDHRTR